MLSSSTMKRASASYSTTRRCHMRLQMMSALSCSTTNNVGRPCHVRLQIVSALSELTISSRDVVMVDAMLSFPTTNDVVVIARRGHPADPGIVRRAPSPPIARPDGERRFRLARLTMHVDTCILLVVNRKFLPAPDLCPIRRQATGAAAAPSFRPFTCICI